MKRFDKNGIMIIPVPEKAKAAGKEMIVIRECFCPGGHNLVNSRVQFGDFPGILLATAKPSRKGLIGLSPVFGDKSRISVDNDLKEGELLHLVCPECGTDLPVYAGCECGGDLVVMFTTPDQDFRNCVGICNRVGCKHAEIKNEGQLMTLISKEQG